MPVSLSPSLPVLYERLTFLDDEFLGLGDDDGRVRLSR